MPLPKSNLAYLDCAELYNKAEESVNNGGKGARVRFESLNDATYFRMRMNQCRAIDRRDNKEIYNPGDPLYQASTWDALMVTIKEVDGEFYVYAEAHGVRLDAIEEIPPDDEIEKIINTPPEQHAPPREVRALRR